MVESGPAGSRPIPYDAGDGQSDLIDPAAEVAFRSWLAEPSGQRRKAFFDAVETLLRSRRSDDDMSRALSETAGRFLEFFERYGDAASLESAMTMAQAAVNFQKADTSAQQRANAHSVLASVFHLRARGSQEHSDFEAACMHASIGLDHVEQGSPTQGELLALYGVIRLDEYRLTKDPSALDDAERSLNRAVPLLADHKDALVVALENYAVACGDRRRVRGGERAAKRAVRLYRRALSLREPETPQWAATATRLANARWHASRSSNARARREIRKLLLDAERLAGPSDMPSVHMQLGRSYLDQYERNNDAEAHRLAAVHLAHAVDQRSPSELEGLQAYQRLSMLGFDRKGSYAELEKAIAASLRLVHEQPDFEGFYTALANALLARYEHRGDGPDLDDAVAAYEHALKLAQPGTSAVQQNNLANAYAAKWEATGEDAWRDRALALYRDSIGEPAAPKDAMRHRTNLAAFYLRTQPRQNADHELIDAAIALLRESQSLVPRHSPESRSARLMLARAQAMRSSATHSVEDLELAESTVRALVGREAPRDRFAHQAEELLAVILMIKRNGDARFEAIELLGRARSETAWLRHFGDAGSMLGHQRRVVKLAKQLVSALLVQIGEEKTGEQRAPLLRKAFLEIEASRSMLLTDLLRRFDSPAPPSVPKSLVDEEKRLIQTVSELDRLYELAGPRSELELEAQERRVERLRQRTIAFARLLQVQNAIRASGPEGERYADRRADLPWEWSDVEDLLRADPGRVLVSLSVMEQQAIAVIAKAHWSFPIAKAKPLSAAQLDLLRRRFAREVPVDPSTQRRATWTTPLVPVFSEIAEWVKGAERVALSVPPELWGLPLSLVARDAGWWTDDEVQPMTMNATFCALNQLVRRDTAAKGHPLVLGDPTGDLPHAREEAATVARALGTRPLVGKRATHATALRELPKASLIHIAGHGTHVECDPLKSGLRLADGILTAADILSLPLNARLVTLSGCDTGLLAELRGDELAGLGHAFLQAGAGCVVMSLWRIEDQSTALLMQSFYQAYSQNNDAAVALASAMQLHRGVRSHPHYWAPFVVMGR